MCNINIVLVKVKEHSDDVLNQHANELARNGLTSPSFIIFPNDIQFNTKALTMFKNCSANSVLETDTREFIWNIQQANFFEQLISLKRLTFALSLHDSTIINWDCTLYSLQHDIMTSEYHITFAQN